LLFTKLHGVISKHNHVLTVLCEGAEEDLGLPRKVAGREGREEREREEVTRGWTEEVAGGGGRPG
jgi:hypothetical protein